MGKVLRVLILISVIAYGEELPQLKAIVSGKNDRVEIKIKKVEKSKINRSELLVKNYDRIIEHSIKKGETLSEIIRKYKVSISQILEQNKQIKDIDLIYAGDTLIIKK